MTWISARELAAIYRVPIGTIYRWANEDDWPRIGWGRHTRYQHERAEETYHARRPTATR